MNDPFPTHTESPPEKPRSYGALAAGFAVGALPWLGAFTDNHGYNQIGWLVAACFVFPAIGGVLALIRKTRRFGLGLLLACGLGWLVLGAMCGGLIR